jgi:beta-lactamase regulating signal transducer with metallopeptidase domain
MMVESSLPWIVLGWLVGVFGLSLWYLGGWTQLQRLRRRMVSEVSPDLKAKFAHLAKTLGIVQTIELVESALVQVPTVIGHLKPIILLPASALTGLNADQIEAILAHELAHIRRHDYMVNLVQTVVEILGFYHPAIWWISHTIRVERENCCDDIAVNLCRNKWSYAKALTTMEEIRGNQPAFALAASGGNLLGRIRRLLGKEATSEVKSSWLPSVMAILLIVALLIPTALALSGDNKEQVDEKGDSDAQAIIQKVLVKYAIMKSYSAEGEVISDIDMSNNHQVLKHTFKVKLARPNLYCVEWQQKFHGFNNTGAVWTSDGQEHFLFNAGKKTSRKDRMMALASATGVSGGAAHTIPALFFDGPSAILKTIGEVESRGEEEIDGDQCYRLSGQLLGMTIKFWISKKTLLIRQRQHVLGGKIEMPEIPEMADEDVAEALKDNGEEVTAEAIQKFKETIKSAPALISGIKGTITETHRNIIVNGLISPIEFIADVKEVDDSDHDGSRPPGLARALDGLHGKKRRRAESHINLGTLGSMYNISAAAKSCAAPFILLTTTSNSAIEDCTGFTVFGDCWI